MQKTIDFIDNLNERIGRTIAWLTLFMVIITFVIVILRYIFNMGWIALQESVNFLHALVFMLGAAYALKQNAHIRVDIFLRIFSQKTQAWVDLLGTIFLLLPVCIFMFWVSWDYVLNSWQLSEGSREAGGLGGVYLLKSILLVMPLLMILQGIAEILRATMAIMNGQPFNYRKGESQEQNKEVNNAS